MSRERRRCPSTESVRTARRRFWRVRGIVDPLLRPGMDLEPAAFAGCAPRTTAGQRARQVVPVPVRLARRPHHYTQRFGHLMLRRAPSAVSIGIRERDQWLACMSQAMRERDIDPAMAERLEAFFGTAGCATRAVEEAAAVEGRSSTISAPCPPSCARACVKADHPSFLHQPVAHSCSLRHRSFRGRVV